MRGTLVKKKRTIVDVQKTSLTESKTTYWDWAAKNNWTEAERDDEGFSSNRRPESCRANPDILPEGNPFERGSNSTLAMQILCNAVDRLVPRQKLAYIKVIREEKTEQEAADEMGIAHQNVHKLLMRAQIRITEYCRKRMGEFNGLED